MTAIQITGIGILSPLGTDRRAFEAALGDPARTGIDELTLFDPVGACEHAAEVGAYDWKDDLFTTQTYADRLTQLAMGAARRALEDAGLALPIPEDGYEIGLAFGTARGCLDSVESFGRPVAAGQGRRASSLVFSHSFPNSPASMISIEYGLRGYGTCFYGSDDAGRWALRSAVDALRAGTATRMLAGGGDALSAACFAHGEGTHRVPATRGRVAPDGRADEATRDEWRRVPGEGAVFFLLETDAAAAERGASPCMEAECFVDPVELVGENTTPAPDWRFGDAGAAGWLQTLAAHILAPDAQPG